MRYDIEPFPWKFAAFCLISSSCIVAVVFSGALKPEPCIPPRNSVGMCILSDGVLTCKEWTKHEGTIIRQFNVPGATK